MLLVLLSFILLIGLLLIIKTCCIKVCEKNANITQEEDVVAETPSRDRTVAVSVITAVQPPPATAPSIPTTARINDAFIDTDLPPSYEEAIKLPPNRHYQPSPSSN